MLERLRERKLFQWAVAYLAGAWLGMQVVEVVADPWNLPDGVVRAIQVLGAVGLIATLVLAWYHGERGRQRVTGPELLILAALLAVAALLVTRLAGEGEVTMTGAAPLTSTPISGTPEPASVAVLPFRDLSPESDQAYFAEGVAEEILAALSHLDGLKVAARTSSFAFEGRGMDVRSIGRTLGVASVLEGSVRKVGDRVRIEARLVSAEDGFELWSSTFDRELTDIFAIQEQIARAIALTLEVTLQPAAERSLTPEATSDLEGYDLYLLGRHHWASRDVQGLRRAVEYFEAAIARDPDFAPAYAGLADAYEALPWYDTLAPADVLGRAGAAARRAVELAPDLPEAHASLGVIAAEYDWDWETAETRLKRAIELGPSYAPAHQWYQTLLSSLGRHEEALRHGRTALELDPLSAVIAGDVAATFATAGRWEEAFELLDRLVRMEGAVPLHHFERAVYLLRAGRVEEGASGLVRWAEARGIEDPERLRRVGRAVEDTSGRAPARSVVSELEASGELDPVQAIPIHVLLGDVTAAMARVERAFAVRSGWVVYMGTLHWYDGLRSEPRFAELLESIGLPNGR